MRMTASLVILHLLIMVLGGCGGGESSEPDLQPIDTTRVLAVVEDLEITERMLEEELERLPYFQRASYDSPRGRRILVDDMVEREVLLRAARALGMEDDPFVAAQVDRARRQVEDARRWAMVQAYYREAGIESFMVPEEAVLEYYQAHSVELYRQREQVRVSILVVEAPADTTAMRAALDGGAFFGTIASSRSTHAPTAAADGDMGWVTVGSSMPYLGLRPELSDPLFSSTRGEVLGPFRTDLGWTYLTVTERREESVLPLEEVRYRIENTLAVTLVETTLSEEILPALAETYGVTFHEEAIESMGNVGPE